MSNIAPKNATHAQDVFIETFLAVSRVCLQGTDDLLTLNANRVREVVADSAALIGGLGGVGSVVGAGIGEGPREARSDVLAPVIERTLTYSRNLYEILAHTHAEIAEVMRSRMSVSDMPGVLPRPWLDVATMFARATERSAEASGRSHRSRPDK